MGIKLKNLVRQTGIKVVALILCILCIMVALLQLIQLDKLNVNGDNLFVEKYEESDEFQGFIHSAIIAVGIARGELAYSPWDELIQKKQLHYYLESELGTYQSGEHKDREYFEGFKYYYIYESGNVFASDNIRPTIIYLSDLELADRLYLALDQDFMQESQIEWEKQGELLKTSLINIGITLLLAIVSFIYLLCVVGKKPYNEDSVIWKIDYIYTEMTLAVALFIGAFYLMFVNDINWYFQNSSDNNLWLLLFEAVTIIALVLLAIMGCSIIRKIRGKLFLKQSIIYRFICWVTSGIKACYRGLFDASMFAKYTPTKSLFYRQTIFIIVSGISVLFGLFFLLIPGGLLLALLMVGFEILLIYLYISGNLKIYKTINEGIHESLEEQIKAERMKVALITNVSHDLKTPLTSIISYADLLSKEELDDTSKDYVRILQDKSELLKNIVVDLFDLAKSSTGNISLDLEEIDLKRLLEQTLADMSDRIEDAHLKVKINLPSQPTMILADGKRLYRVFQNLIDNTIKYTMAETRVFIEMNEQNGIVITEIKNIASYEMDFTAEEVLQRFNRGDKSRSTEGSGLGLSIAESFARVCGGEFKVTIDGDMFKVTIMFPVHGMIKNRF